MKNTMPMADISITFMKPIVRMTLIDSSEGKVHLPVFVNGRSGFKDTVLHMICDLVPFVQIKKA